jgi:hypothetical protein
MCFFINENLHKLVLKFKFLRCSIFNDQYQAIGCPTVDLLIILHIFQNVNRFFKIFFIFFGFFEFSSFFHKILCFGGDFFGSSGNQMRDYLYFAQFFHKNYG